jgi:threonylcarbamoyladenosine tRNA methylthiotransferase MtaB
MLLNLSLKKQRLFYESHLGQTRRVLVEKSKNPELLTGFTDNYIKVSFPFKEGLRNQIVDLKLQVINEQYLVEGEMV